MRRVRHRRLRQLLGPIADNTDAVLSEDPREGLSMRETVKRLDEMCDAASVQASWYLKDLATGASAHRLGGVPVPSASTRKISIMMAALAAVHAGKLALDQKVTIEARYLDNDSGTFQHLTPGFWITLRDALVMMIIVSDNTCTGAVVDLVGLENVQRYTEAVGLTGTIHRYGIPPRGGADDALDRSRRRRRTTRCSCSS
jgi:beta-lactamase class A